MRRSSDYGGQPSVRHRPWLFALMATVVVTPVLVVVARHDLAVERRLRVEAVAQSRAFSGAGAPCREITPADLSARGRPLKNLFGFNGVWFARRFGHADCALIGQYESGGGDGYPACRFTAPAIVRVTTPERDRVFDVGVGQAAAVSVRDGEPRCRLIAPFRFP